MPKSNLALLKEAYKERKAEIIKRLEDFRGVWDKGDKEIFSELCFCLLTPQSKAQACDKIIKELVGNRLLFNGRASQICPYVKRARFYKNKSRYIVCAREFFLENGRISIKKHIDVNDVKAARNWLVENITGIGYKEASHFLRNVGFGDDIAILDIHILRNLNRLGVIKDVPRSLTKKMYLEIEGRLSEFSKRSKIPMAHLDLLFWSMATGKIFK